MKRFVLFLLFSFLIFNLANAAIVSYTDNTGAYQDVDFDDTLILNEFNSSLGTLTFAELFYTAETRCDITITNNDNGTRFIFGTVRFPIDFNCDITGLTKSPDMTVLAIASTYPGDLFSAYETKVYYDVLGSETDSEFYYQSSDLAEFIILDVDKISSLIPTKNNITVADIIY